MGQKTFKNPLRLIAAAIAVALCLAPQSSSFAQFAAPDRTAQQRPALQQLKPDTPLNPQAPDSGKPVVKPIVPPELPPEPQKPVVMEDMNTVVVRTIDKLSARTHTFDIPVNKTVKFGNSLFIKVRACRKSSPLDQPESAAFLQIWEHRPDQDEAHWVFSGWMFSSSPALSAMDHPVYDVWVIECKNAKTSANAAADFSAEQAPGKVPPVTAAPDAAHPTSSPQTDTPAPIKPVSPAAAPVDKPAPGAVPPIDQLPGSFDDDSGTDKAAPSDDTPEE